jgi:hypothetical protein
MLKVEKADGLNRCDKCFISNFEPIPNGTGFYLKKETRKGTAKLLFIQKDGKTKVKVHIGGNPVYEEFFKEFTLTHLRKWKEIWKNI